MSRKILAICAALVAFAALVAMPALGSAATLTDTNSEGKVVKVATGSKIVAMSTGIFFWTGSLGIECNENLMTMTVHKNSEGLVEGTIEDAWIQSNLVASSEHETPCRSAGSPATYKTNLTNSTVGTKTHWCIKSVKGTDNWEMVPRGCTEASGGVFTFSYEMSNGLTCGLTRSAAITGTFNTVSGATHTATTLTMSGEPEFTTDNVPGHSVFCQSTARFKNFVFDLYTDTDATPAGVHKYPPTTTDPIFTSTP